MAAIVDDYVYGVKRLIQAGADVNRRNEGDGTPVPLIWAGYEGRDECIELLLNAGADVNAHTGGPYKQYTALHAAVEAGNITTVELLLKAGPDLNKEGWLYYRFTALSLALTHGYDEAVKLLIQAGADVNKVPERGNSSVMEVIESYAAANQKAKCLQLLIEAGADVNMTTPEGKVPLVEASINWFNEGVKILIQAGADVNKFCPYCDETPLMVATSRGNTKITELLLERGADVNSANSNGYTALMEVASRVPILKSDEYTENYLGCPKILLRYGAKINLINIDSHNALYCVLHRPIRSSQHSDICRLLFVAGETLDGITDAENTCLPQI